GARLGGRDVALDRAPDLAPEVGDPADGFAEAEEIGDVSTSTASAGGRRGRNGGAAAATAAARALRRGADRLGREKAGPRLRDDRLRLAEGGVGRLQVLVRDVDPSLQL